MTEPEGARRPVDKLTAEEARTLADDLNFQLYQAQDALAFVEECCVIADREGRTVTTADVREWLRGAQCGRQAAASLPAPAPARAAEPHTGLVVQPYRADDGRGKWVFRCWGTDDGCDGWLSLDHTSEQSAERARDRHVAEEHAPTRTAGPVEPITPDSQRPA